MATRDRRRQITMGTLSETPFKLRDCHRDTTAGTSRTWGHVIVGTYRTLGNYCRDVGNVRKDVQPSDGHESWDVTEIFDFPAPYTAVAVSSVVYSVILMQAVTQQFRSRSIDG